MKKIYLYIVPFFPSPRSWRGGFFYDFAKGLIDSNCYDVKVLSIGQNENYVYHGIQVLGVKTFKIGASDWFAFITDYIKIYFLLKKMYEEQIHLNDIAVCHINLIDRMAFYGTLFKIISPKCKLLFHHHWSGVCPLPGGRLLKIPLVRELEYLRLYHQYKNADVHVFCSQQTQARFNLQYDTNGVGRDLREMCRFSNLLPKLKIKNSMVFYNGVNTHLFSKKNDGNDAIHDGKFRIGCVANFTPTKSQRTLIEAFYQIHEICSDVVLLFVGSGATLHECKILVQRFALTDKVFFIEEMDHSKLASFYLSLDLYVLPSYFEAFNCSLVEAWACGVPCIATKEISFGEVLFPQDRDFWLFPAKDSKTLAKCILNVYHNNVAQQVLSKNLNITHILKQFLENLIERTR